MAKKATTKAVESKVQPTVIDAMTDPALFGRFYEGELMVGLEINPPRRVQSADG